MVSFKLKNNDKLVIGCIYRSPNSSYENNKELFDLMKSVKDTQPSHLLIMGDFNFKEVDWNRSCTTVNESHVLSKLLECVKDCFLFQHVSEPTI